MRFRPVALWENAAADRGIGRLASAHGEDRVKIYGRQFFKILESRRGVESGWAGFRHFILPGPGEKLPFPPKDSPASPDISRENGFLRRFSARPLH
jgi:hypothetical protein